MTVVAVRLDSGFWVFAWLFWWNLLGLVSDSISSLSSGWERAEWEEHCVVSAVDVEV